MWSWPSSNIHRWQPYAFESLGIYPAAPFSILRLTVSLSISCIGHTMPNSTTRHPNCDLMIQATTKEWLCGVKTGEFDQSSVLRCRILESILSTWKRSLRGDFLGCSCKHICCKLQCVVEMKFRQLYDLGRPYRATLNPWFQTYFSLRFHHSYASYRPIYSLVSVRMYSLVLQ